MTSVHGIVLAGGAGTRLDPLTRVVSKQLLPVFNKPMIYYPICTLMQLGIRDISIISSPEQLHRFERLLGDGTQWAVNFDYVEQPSPDGLAQSFLLTERQILGKKCCLILGDNLFHSSQLNSKLMSNFLDLGGCQIFGYEVADPQRYGVLSFENEKPIAIEEKPANPKSNIAITGLYFFDETVAKRARKIVPSPRGELEITDLISSYLASDQLSLTKLTGGSAWLDTGTFEALMDAGLYIQTLEKRQGISIGDPATQIIGECL